MSGALMFPPVRLIGDEPWAAHLWLAQQAETVESLDHWLTLAESDGAPVRARAAALRWFCQRQMAMTLHPRMPALLRGELSLDQIEDLFFDGSTHR